MPVRLFSPVIAVLVWILALEAVSAAVSAGADEFRSKSGVDLNRFAGAWYELGRTPNKFVDNTLRKHGEKFSACYNATARYTITKPGKLRIVKTCLRRSAQGTVISDTATGVAVVEDGSAGRKLQVTFGSGIARAFQRLLTGGGAGYRIYCLGPVNGNGLYDWAVVSSEDRDSMFLLSRKRSVPKGTKQRMLRCARNGRLPVGKLIYRQQ